jgi:hypothetical protein
MANVVYWDNSNLCKNNYYYALATEFVPNRPLLHFQLIIQASPILAPMVTTSLSMPQLPTATPRLQPLKSAWPTVAPNARWPVPPLHLQPLYLRQLQQGMSCLISPIPSLAWAHLPTKTAYTNHSHSLPPRWPSNPFRLAG